MSITKSFLRHEIQNILTILGLQIEDSNLKKKTDMLNLIGLISLFTEYEDFLLNSKISFHSHVISVEDLFQIIEFSLLEIIPQKKVKINFKRTNGFLKIDREHLLKALKSFFVYIAGKVAQFECDFEETKKKILIVHDGGFLNIKKQSLEEVLCEGRDYELINFHLALHLLELFGCKLLSSENKIEICFPNRGKV